MGAFLAEYKKEAEARIRETVQAEGVICSQAEVEIEKDEKSGEYGTIRKIILHLKVPMRTMPRLSQTSLAVLFMNVFVILGSFAGGAALDAWGPRRHFLLSIVGTARNWHGNHRLW